MTIEPAMAATITRAEMRTAPYTLLRVNPLSARPIWTGHHRQLDRIAALRAERAVLAQPLLNRLYALAATVPGQIKYRVVLPVCRAVFNDREPKASEADLAALGVGELIRWLELLRAESCCRAKLPALVVEALTADRERLRDLLGHRDFLAAAALSSPNLARGAHRYAATPFAEHTKRLRKSEPKLSRYAERAAYKTSPFSHFTVVSAGTWAPVSSGRLDLSVRTARMQPNLLLVLRLVDAAMSRPEFAQHLTYRLADGLRRTETGYRFDVMNDEPGQLRIYRTRRSTVAIGRSAAADLVVDALLDNANGLTLADLGGLLATLSLTPLPTQATRDYVEKLRLAGLLVPTLRVSQQDTAPALEFAGRCAALPGAEPRRLAGQLRELHEATVHIGGLDGSARADAVEELRTAWTTAFAAWSTLVHQTESSLYEDVALRECPAVSTGRWATVKADLARLLPALEPLNMNHPGQALLTRTLVYTYGQGGHCSYADFVALLPGVFTAERADLPSILAEIDGRDAELKELLDLRERYLLAATGAEPEVELSDELIDELAARTPARFRRPWASACAFVQPLDAHDGEITEVVVNVLLDGNGQFLSRFLALYDRGWTERVRAHLRGTLPTGATELRPVQGFNANVHPALLDRQFAVTREDAGTPVDEHTTVISIKDLAVAHDSVTGRLLLLDGQGRQVHPRYLGFLVPYLLPWELTALYLLSEPGQLRICAANEWEHRVPPAGLASIRRYPRVRYRSLGLARRRWYVPIEQMPVAESAEDLAEFLVRLDWWRATHDIPQHVFLARIGDSDTDSLGRPKPMYADLRSPLHARSLAAWLAGARTVRIEEALPSPAGRQVVDPHVGTNTVEYMIEYSQASVEPS